MNANTYQEILSLSYQTFLEEMLHNALKESDERLLYEDRAFDMIGAIDRWRYVVWNDSIDNPLYDGYDYNKALEVLFTGVSNA